MTSTFDVKAHVAAILAERARTMAQFVPGYRPVTMYAIYRADLEMGPHKLGAQLGHAFDLAAEAARALRPEMVGEAYRGTGMGKKTVMYAKNLHQLERALEMLHGTNIPHALVVDRGHVYGSKFDGSPIVTALGIGPVYEDEFSHISKRYTLGVDRPRLV